MPTHEIWDANIFRNIGAGDLALSDLQKPGVTICYSPVTLLELSSRYTDDSFEHRKAAAQVIIDSGAQLLPDPETYLTRDVFGFALKEAEFDWSHAVKAMAQSQSMQELQTGVADFNARLRRKINLTFAWQYREGLDRGFVEDMLKVQKNEIPGFSEWWNPDPLRRAGQVPKLSGDAKIKFLEDAATPQFAVAIIEACRARALYMTNDNLPWPPTPEWVTRIVEAGSRLECYIKIYIQYLIRLLTDGMLARVNDWFDLEILIYSSDDDHVIMTTEKKWPALAKLAGIPERVVKVSTS